VNFEAVVKWHHYDGNNLNDRTPSSHIQDRPLFWNCSRDSEEFIMKFARCPRPQIDSKNTQNTHPQSFPSSPSFHSWKNSTFRAAACAFLVPILCGWFLAASAEPEIKPQDKVCNSPAESADASASEMSVAEMLSLASKQLEDKLYFSAIETYTSCLDKDPRNASALAGRARAYRESGETEKAICDEKQAQSTGETAVGPLPASQTEPLETSQDSGKSIDDPVRLGNELLRKGDFKAALNQFNIALKRTPNKPELLSSRAFCNICLSKHDKAKVDLDTALRLDPKLAIAYALQGGINNHHKDYTQTIVNTGRSLVLDPNQSLAYGIRAVAFSKQKQMPQALKDADRAVANDPASGLAYYIRAQLLIDQKNDKALNDLIKAMELSPKHLDIYLSVAQVYANRLQWTKSVDILSKYIRENPQSADAYRVRGDLYFTLTRYADALHDANKVVELEPKKASSYVFRISKLIPLKRTQEALRDCIMGLSLEPKNASLFSQRACLYAGNEQYNYAIADATRAIALDPKLAPAYINRGACYAALEKYPLAQADFLKATVLDPKDKDAWHNLGSVYVYLSRYSQAIPCFTKSISIDPRFASVYWDRGRTYRLLGKYDLAARDMGIARALGYRDN